MTGWELRFRTHWFELLSFSWLKLKITGFGLDPLSFRNGGIRAVYTCCICSHSQSPKAALQQKSSGDGWTWVTTHLPKECRGAEVGVTACDIQSRWIHIMLWEFSSLVSQQNRNLLLARRSAPLDLSDSLGASLCREFLLQGNKSRRNRKVLYKLGCAQVAGFQCCCYINYSNKQET